MIQLFWHCQHIPCSKAHPWPEVKRRKYCNRKCRDAAYYRRKHQKWIHTTVLTPAKVERYEMMSGFKTTGHVELHITDDRVFKIFERALIGENNQS